MSLTLTSTDASLAFILKKIDTDRAISPLELRKIRDDADQRVLDATGLDVGKSAPILGVETTRFLFAADDVVEIMQRIALYVRKQHLASGQREELKSAIECQIAYIVAGYQSSIQRL